MESQAKIVCALVFICYRQAVSSLELEWSHYKSVLAPGIGRMARLLRPSSRLATTRRVATNVAQRQSG